MSAINSPVLKKPVKLACVQLMQPVEGSDKAAILKNAAAHVAKAASSGSKIIVLPEYFNSPFGSQYLPKYAETLLPSPPKRDEAPTFHALSAMAADNKVYLIGGSIPEFNPQTKKHYNTSLIFSPDGNLLATYRKAHLFDVDIPGRVTYYESEYLDSGNKLGLIDLPDYGKVAVAICYDIRFPELATIATRKGAFALIYPTQARALDNQLYVVLCGPARDTRGTLVAWGYSLVVDPMAQVVVEAEEKETIVEWELDPDEITNTRKSIPVSAQRRFDIYPDVSAGAIQFDDPKLEEP
ncbi:CN hydrolase domain-containing protein [Fusarium sp. LHS14.1]|nr:CN hydrolase domain-containing protein [Fusarium sp. LHS14.1]